MCGSFGRLSSISGFLMTGFATISFEKVSSAPSSDYETNVIGYPHRSDADAERAANVGATIVPVPVQETSSADTEN
jgi:hypothetical protein